MIFHFYLTWRYIIASFWRYRKVISLIATDCRQRAPHVSICYYTFFEMWSICILVEYRRCQH